MKKAIPILLLILFWACSDSSPYPGYSKGRQGIYYHLQTLGENNRKARYGDFITADIQYMTMKDSVFFRGRRKLELTKSEARGSIEACFRMLAEGESASFIISADEFFSKTLATELPEFLLPGPFRR